jgi:hypothetical protein
MRILKSLLVGICAALLAAVLGTFVELALALSRITGEVSGGGGLGAVSFETHAPYYALIGFIAGFYWKFRRRARSTEIRRPARTS